MSIVLLWESLGRWAGIVVIAAGAVSMTRVSSAAEPGSGVSMFDVPRIELARPLACEEGAEDVGAGVEAQGDGAVIVGWTSKSGAPEDALLVRVDALGDVVWRKSLGGGGEDLLWDVHADGGGGFVAAGYSARPGAKSAHDAWLVRFTPAGEVAWERRFGGPADVRFYSLARDGDGWLCAGQMEDDAGDVDAIAIRVTSDGEEKQRFIWKTPTGDRSFAAQPAGDGCVLAGMTGRGHDDAHAFVVKVDATGREVWRTVLADWVFSVVHGLRPMAHGRFLATGYRQTGAPLGVQGFAMVVDANGAIVRDTTLGSAGEDRMLHSVVLSNGACIVVGYAQAPGARDGRSGWDLALTAVDAAGGVRWSGRFGGEGTEFGRGVAVSGSDVWVVGHSMSGKKSGSAVYLVRLDVAPLVREGVGPGKP